MEERCPHCGYCPHCGRSNFTPVPYPYSPAPYPSPYPYWWGTITVGNGTSATVPNNFQVTSVS